jgi:hypothetical protein
MLSVVTFVRYLLYPTTSQQNHLDLIFGCGGGEVVAGSGGGASVTVKLKLPVTNNLSTDITR